MTTTTTEAITERGTIKTITTHYIDGAFVESHGREVMDIIKPTNGKVIARVTLGDEEDTRLAIAAAKRALVTFGRTTKEERARYLRQLHQAVSARIDDLTAAMVDDPDDGHVPAAGDPQHQGVDHAGDGSDQPPGAWPEAEGVRARVGWRPGICCGGPSFV